MIFIKLKKAAMFGLDARISLAIFGALSVISGAALYSAIEQSKVVSMAAQLSEIAKAYEAYYLDTGFEAPMRSGNTRDMDIDALRADNGVAGWNGPYLSFEFLASYAFNYKFSYDTAKVYIQRCGNNFGNTFSITSCELSSAGNEHVYIKLTSFNNMQNAIAKLDEYIDGSDGYDKGKIRAVYADATASDNMRLFYYVKPIN